MPLRTAILWIHALSGVVWTGACAALVLAGSTLTAGSEEWREFALSVAPRLDRLNLGAAAILLTSGIVNFLMAGAARDYHFSPTFIAVLASKIGLFAVMAAALAISWRIEGALAAELGRGMRRMMALAGVTAIAGTVALGLGLWLMGS